MASLLYKLGKTAYRKWPFFLIAWFLVLGTLGFVGATYGKPTVDSFSIPGIPSEEASKLQEKIFGPQEDAFEDASVTVVVQNHRRLAKDRPEVNALVKALKDLPQLTDEDASLIVSPLKAASSMPEDSPMSPVSENGRVGTITFSFSVDTPADVEASTIEALKKVMEEHTTDDFIVAANGNGLSGNVEMGYTSELIGIGVALIVLILTFGALVSAGLPILNAIIGVAVGSTAITAATAFMDVNSSTPMLASMIGLAVGIDYALFILARYKTELSHGSTPEEATAVAVGTAGSAVVFAGLTVIIALSALAVVRIPFLTAMGLAAALTVALAVAASLTFLPAILGLLKNKTFKGQVRKYEPKRDTEGHMVNNGLKFAQQIEKRPIVFLGTAAVLLLLLAMPVKNLFLAFPTDSTKPPATTQRQASDMIAEAFGPGREGPLLLVVDAENTPSKKRVATMNALAAYVNDQPNVATAFLAATNSPDPVNKPMKVTGGIITIIPETGPNDEKTVALLNGIREQQSEVEAQFGVTLGVTGLTAITADISERLQSALPVYLAVVVGLAFLLLLVVFRSIVIPFTATLGFLLSVLATLGVTVLIFQEGTFGLMDPQPIVSFMPVILIGIIFGLAMDYQVFLTSRMKEAHTHGLSARDAILDGFRHSARVVVAAATIMIAVFSGFMLQPDPVIKSMGFALAVAIVLDAFIVRMIIVPSLLFLLGEKAWQLPKFLERILPVIDVEGESLTKGSGFVED